MEKNADVGVLVARFQGEELHAGWRGLIDMVKKRHPKRMLIALGVHGGLRTKRDPLTYEEREYMVREAYPDSRIAIKPIRNHPFSHKLWSRNLDNLIMTTFPKSDAILYGSRDSFIPKYSGAFPTESITPKEKYSGTELRANAKMPKTKAGRSAIIYSQNERPDMLYSTVDMAIVDKRERRVLLITKNVFDGLWSFPGGFSEPSSRDDLDDAMREFSEEILGVEVSEFTCLTPHRIRMNDPRYRDSKDGTRTSLYIAEYRNGSAVGGDDAEVARWFPADQLLSILVPWHKPLGEILLKSW